jgi:hypothetical protein
VQTNDPTGGFGLQEPLIRNMWMGVSLTKGNPPVFRNPLLVAGARPFNSSNFATERPKIMAMNPVEETARGCYGYGLSSRKPSFNIPGVTFRHRVF